MFYQLIAPPPELSTIVRNYWILESYPGEVIPDFYQSMADCCPEIIFQYNGGFSEYRSMPVYFKSQKAMAARLTMTNSIGLFGIRLFPHAVPQLLEMPSDEVANQVLDLRDLMEVDNRFSDAMFEKCTHQKRISIVTSFIKKNIAQTSVDPISKLVWSMIRKDGKVDLEELRAPLNISERQFERRFKMVSGFSPKHYSKLIRFQSARRKYLTGSYDNFAALAYDCDYADQSHFIRDFKQFGGMQPAEYFRLLFRKGSEEGTIMRQLIARKELPQ